MPKSKRPPIELQSRDLEILRSVYEHRFLTRSLILPLFGADPGDLDTNLDRRLRKLTAAGYLERLTRADRRTEYVYALTDAGMRILRSHQLPLPLGGTDFRENNRTAKIDRVQHTLMVARWYTAFVVATRDHLPTIQIEHYERESRPSGRHALQGTWLNRRGERRKVNPDALLILAGDGVHPGAHFLEADNSTMGLDYRMADKFEDYAAMYREQRHQEFFDVESFRVCVVTKSRQRAENLMKLLAELEVTPEERKLFWFTPEQNYREWLPNVLAAVWRRGDNLYGEVQALVGNPLPKRSSDKQKGPSQREEP